MERALVSSKVIQSRKSIFRPRELAGVFVAQRMDSIGNVRLLDLHHVAAVGTFQCVGALAERRDPRAGADGAVLFGGEPDALVLVHYLVLVTICPV